MPAIEVSEPLRSLDDKSSMTLAVASGRGFDLGSALNPPGLGESTAGELPPLMLLSSEYCLWKLTDLPFGRSGTGDDRVDGGDIETTARKLGSVDAGGGVGMGTFSFAGG